MVHNDNHNIRYIVPSLHYKRMELYIDYTIEVSYYILQMLDSELH